jgi:hypothetical protein
VLIIPLGFFDVADMRQPMTVRCPLQAMATVSWPSFRRDLLAALARIEFAVDLMHLATASGQRTVAARRRVTQPVPTLSANRLGGSLTAPHLDKRAAPWEGRAALPIRIPHQSEGRCSAGNGRRRIIGGWASHKKGATLALTGTCSLTGADGRKPTASRSDLRSVATHEFGHATGWSPHLDDAQPRSYCGNVPYQQTMCKTNYAGTTWQRTLGARDLRIFRGAYGQ